MKRQRETVKNCLKKLMAGCMAFTIIAAGVVIVPETVTAAAKEVCYATEAEYDISKYWTEDDATKKVPMKEGYIFGGWYKEDKTPWKESELTNSNIKEIAAIAKFVPSEVLSIKTQAALGDDASSLRLLSSVDCLEYQEVGFEYKLGGKALAKTENITQVYNGIKRNKTASENDLIYAPDTFGTNASQYFIAVDVKDIASQNYTKIVYARPYWVTMDGTTVMGLARNNRIEDKQNDNQYISVGINMLTDGISPADIAAGKIQVKYNTTDYDVHTVDTTKDAAGGKYLLSEMDCRINETEGTITFVGNAGTAYEELMADGLFANVRFKKVTSTEGTTLDFAVNSEETYFCNWEETQETKFVVQ